MNRTDSFFVRAHHRRRASIVIGLSISLFIESGCATARPAIQSLWKQVPPVRWTSKASDSNSTSRAEPAAEPEMAANVAVKSDGDGEPDAFDTASSSGGRTKSPLTRLGARFNRSIARSTDNPSAIDPGEADESQIDSFAGTERSDSSMERLNAALTDDALQSQSLPQRSLTTLDARVRVETLLSRAKEMLEIGQLEQARHIAIIALKLGDAAQLDFSPDEDRPIDLVRRIDGQLEANQVMDDSAPGGNSPDVPEIHQKSMSSDLDHPDSKPSSPLVKDASGLARIRRDWSTLFRREKKSATSEPSASGRQFKPTKPSPTSEVTPRNEQTNRVSESNARDAIVMANRSIALGTLESFETSAASFEPDEGERSTNETASIVSESSRRTGSRLDDDSEQRTKEFSVAADSMKPSIDADDRDGTPPEFDVVEPSIPTHAVDTDAEETATLTDGEGDEPVRHSDWTLIYLAFAACSVLAFGCYRRGAV